MSNERVSQIFIAHPQKFTVNLLKRFFADKEMDLYHLEEYKDFAYLLEDLAPVAFIMHKSILDEHEEHIFKEIAKRSSMKQVVISPEDLDQDTWTVDLVVKEPFDPEIFVAQVQNMLR